MNESVKSRVKFRGIEFLETVTPMWSPGSGGKGMVTWEIDRELPCLQEYYDPDVDGSEEAAREKIKQFLLRILPEDGVR